MKYLNEWLDCRFGNGETVKGSSNDLLSEVSAEQSSDGIQYSFQTIGVDPELKHSLNIVCMKSNVNGVIKNIGLFQNYLLSDIN